MTRLADALERANRAPDPAPQRPAAPQRAAAPTPAAGPVRAAAPTPAAGPVRAAAPAPAAAAAPAAAPKQHGHGHGHARRLQPAAIVAARHAAPGPQPAVDTPLIGMPKDGDICTLWRSDPQLVGKLLGTEAFSGAALEQYRKLAATLHHAQNERGIRVIMTASALPGEGKSLTAVNLALTLSESYRKRVLLVDADLRRPTVQRVFGLPPVGGLNEGLKLSEDRAMAVTQISEQLFVLPAGRPEADPMSGLTSNRMRRLITQAAAAFEWVIIDTPPVGLLPDASLLADFVDGVLLVVRAGKAPFALVKRTVEAISHDRILGVVMNAVDYAHDRNAGGYYEYYGGGYYGGTPGQK